jgi:hypothetical protein
VKRLLALYATCGSSEFVLFRSNRATSWDTGIPYLTLLISYYNVRNKARVIHERQFQAGW